MPHTNSMCEVFGPHQSKCNGLHLWTKKPRLKPAAEPWLLPERHLPVLLSGDIVPHTGSSVACSRLTRPCSLKPLMHGSHLCSALEGQQSMQSQKQLLQFCFDGIACSPWITHLWLWINVCPGESGSQTNLDKDTHYPACFGSDPLCLGGLGCKNSSWLLPSYAEVEESSWDVCSLLVSPGADENAKGSQVLSLQKKKKYKFKKCFLNILNNLILGLNPFVLRQFSNSLKHFMILSSASKDFYRGLYPGFFCVPPKLMLMEAAGRDG